jgi:hypothetical protein
VLIVLKCGSLNLLEPSGPVQGLLYLCFKIFIFCVSFTKFDDGCFTEHIKLTITSSFTFMGPCIVNVFKLNQQDPILHNTIYYYKRSTCFRQFLRPSSGAQNCLQSIGYLSSFSASYTHDSGKKQKKLDKYPMVCLQF